MSEGFDPPEAPDASDEAPFDLLEPLWEPPRSEPLLLPLSSDELAPPADVAAVDAPSESPLEVFFSDETAFFSDAAASLSDEAAFLYSSLR